MTDIDLTALDDDTLSLNQGALTIPGKEPTKISVDGINLTDQDRRHKHRGCLRNADQRPCDLAT